MNKDKVVIILRAAPNAGKTTFANYINWLAGGCGEVLSADDYFTNPITGEYNYDIKQIGKAHDFCRNKFMAAIHKEKSPIIIANTNQRDWEFQFYLDNADIFGYSVVSLVVENRHGNKNYHQVPEDKIKLMAENIKNSLKLI